MSATWFIVFQWRRVVRLEFRLQAALPRTQLAMNRLKAELQTAPIFSRNQLTRCNCVISSYLDTSI
jgi:hypothetical protein